MRLQTKERIVFDVERTWGLEFHRDCKSIGDWIRSMSLGVVDETELFEENEVSFRA